ncbi:hypothetical protein [Bradyrhizobium sp. 17]|uniref:hypothetical protein n=1 Tax=Bradyrhizobium sp. 17 TaxID=2782649 RepID=UPI001FF9AD3A|nr:hypothetical protein [Bradyrhizobium sp. 17]MCK1521936.1 hypothetical protein [Bradyrhizobium sp. 17]
MLCLIQGFQQGVQKCTGVVVTCIAVCYCMSAQAEFIAHRFRTNRLGALCPSVKKVVRDVLAGCEKMQQPRRTIVLLVVLRSEGKEREQASEFVAGYCSPSHGNAPTKQQRYANQQNISHFY